MSTPKHRMRQAPIALDGLRARANRPYAREKRSFIERFVPPALTNLTARVFARSRPEA